MFFSIVLVKITIFVKYKIPNIKDNNSEEISKLILIFMSSSCPFLKALKIYFFNQLLKVRFKFF